MVPQKKKVSQRGSEGPSRSSSKFELIDLWKLSLDPVVVDGRTVRIIWRLGSREMAIRAKKTLVMGHVKGGSLVIGEREGPDFLRIWRIPHLLVLLLQEVLDVKDRKGHQIEIEYTVRRFVHRWKLLTTPL